MTTNPLDQEDEDASKWRLVADTIRDAMPQVDALLSERDVPLHKRRSEAMEFVRTYMLKTDADIETLIVSEAYARLVALVDDWYRERYGEADRADRDTFASLIFLFDTPFAFDIPLTFRKPGDEPGSAWFAFPAVLQPEEDPLSWIIKGPNLSKLTDAERADLLCVATRRANTIRAINFDLRTVAHGPQKENAELANMIVADLRSAAIALQSSEPGLRASSGWAMSQAVEKAIKLYIRTKGGVPKYVHDLSTLADHADLVGAYRIDRTLLDRVPSGPDAVSLRYGGALSWKQGEQAYVAALDIVEGLASQVEIKSKYNVRNARFLLKPPWFGFDTEGFLKGLKDQSAEPQKAGS